MSETAQIIEQMNSKFNADAAQGMNKVFQFNIEDADNHHIIINDGSCEIQAGDHADPDATLIMDTETFKGIASGETDGMQAFMSGQLKVEGDMMLSTKLSELFPA